MNVLYLGYPQSPIVNCIRGAGDSVYVEDGRISVTSIDLESFDYLVSYGYRFILTEDILNAFPERAINLHISYLPWNRGAHPNFWSILEQTISGVTIHRLDLGIDTGDILLQERVEFDLANETLRTSYDCLHKTIQRIFCENWSKIRDGKLKASPQVGVGSFHAAKEFEQYLPLLSNGWDTPLVEVLTLGDKCE